MSSLTLYKVLDQNNEFSFLVIKPVTGRKHQIRDHLNSLGNQIYGETKFKSLNNSKPISNAKDLHLHAYSLKFQEQDKSIKKLLLHYQIILRLQYKNGFENDLSNHRLEFIDSDNFQLIDK